MRSFFRYHWAVPLGQKSLKAWKKAKITTLRSLWWAMWPIGLLWFQIRRVIAGNKNTLYMKTIIRVRSVFCVMSLWYIWQTLHNTNKSDVFDYFQEHVKISLFQISPGTRHIASHIGCMEIWCLVNVMANMILRLREHGVFQSSLITRAIE